MDPLGIVTGPLEYPIMYEVHQEFAAPAVASVPETTAAALEESGLKVRIAPGMRVAITAGSRGVRNIVQILSTTVGWLRAHGAEPFVVGAMGSHGGGNAAGQLELLASLGVTPDSVHCPVRTSDDVSLVGVTPSGHKVYCDTLAFLADGIVVINRVKPHTSFRGPIESGVCKMMAVGLGKAAGATYVHLLGPAGMALAIPAMAKVFVDSGKVLAGLAILENALDETAAIIGLAPDDIVEREPELLRRANSMMPSLPADRIDVLVVAEMGKNFSGTGMDTNVIGRYQLEGLPDPETPKIKRIAVLDLSEESHGNATGVSLADVCTTRISSQYDRKSTYLNCLTSTFLHRAAIPPAMDNDWAAIGLAARTAGKRDVSKISLMMIRNTLHLESLWVSETLLDQVATRSNASIVSGPVKVEFDSEYSLTSPYCIKRRMR